MSKSLRRENRQAGSMVSKVAKILAIWRERQACARTRDPRPAWNAMAALWEAETRDAGELRQQLPLPGRSVTA